MRAVCLISIFCLIACAKAPNESAVSCQHRGVHGYDVTLCHEPGSTSEVLYYFHGIGGSAQSWEQTALHRHMLLDFPNHPTVISVSFGPQWFLTDVPSWDKPSRLEVFTHEIQPQIELELGLKVSRRWAAGESMGGYNAIRLGIDQPDQYEKILALCPAVMTVGPYSGVPAMAAYLWRNPAADAKTLAGVALFGVLEFPLPYFWDRNSPVLLANQPDFKMPATFISSNSADGYGFNEGDQIFADQLARLKIPVQYVPQPGYHCQHSANMLRDAVSFLKN